MRTRKQLIGLVGLGVGFGGWLLGLGVPVAVVLGLTTTAVLLVLFTRPARTSSAPAGDDVALDRWGSPALNAMLWGGVLFGWANGTGGSGDHFDASGGLDGGGGFDAGGGFDGGGGGSE